VRGTKARLLLGLFAVTAAAGWAIGTLVTGQTGRVVPVPLIAPLTMWMLFIGLLIWTVLSKPRLQRKPGVQPMNPIVAARTAALAMAGSRTGALIGGLYAGVGVAALPQFATQRGAETVWAALAVVLACGALIGVALWLERLCQVPDEEPPSDAIGFHSV